MSTEDFTWRHATIEPSVVYNKTCIGPYELYNGKIYGWEKKQGLEPFSFPKQASAIFDSNFDEKKIKYISSEDKYGFKWYCTEEDAKSFLSNYYPEIFKEKNINL